MNLFKKIFSKASNTSVKNHVKHPVSDEIETYYDNRTDDYVRDYGDIIQAARPASDEEFINFLVESIGLQEGMRLLDAGCGVCGPAIGIAKSRNVIIDGITISKKQVDESRKNIEKEGLSDRIRPIKGDFHKLQEYYSPVSFDIIYFLETLGYAENIRTVLEGSLKVLKAGGYIYIKDFFLVPLVNKEHEKIRQHSLEEIRNQYHYKVPNLTKLISELRSLGLYIEYVRKLDFKEDFAKAAAFEKNNEDHQIYTNVIHNEFQLFEPLELKFKKLH